MADIFLKIINMSITASWLILAVMLLRLLLKKAPKWINGILWALVGLRLVMPFPVESIFSLIPSAETIGKAPDAPRPYLNSGVAMVDNPVNDYWRGNYYEGVSRPTGYFGDVTAVLAIIWVIGMVALLLYAVISSVRLNSKIKTAVLFRENIFQSERVPSPFVLGIIKPKIYLPFQMKEQDMEHVIAHEQSHIRRKDHWWKPLGFLFLAIYWFHPLMWFGYGLLCRDIELACDEKVIKKLNAEQKADYSQALLTCSVNRRMIAACPLAFGEVGVKSRVKSVLHYKKPAFWLVLVGIMASVAIALCFLTNPVANRLGNIESAHLDASLGEQTAVMISNGKENRYVGSVDKQLLKQLFDTRISRQELSLSRAEDRDQTNTIILNLAADTEQEMLTSFVNKTSIHFNHDFSEVWVDNGVKPTFSYGVRSPAEAKRAFEQIVGESRELAVIGGVDNPKKVITESDEEPPAMTVSSEKANVTAWRGTYSWLYKSAKDGRAQASNADASHPLYRLNEVGTLPILPATRSLTDPLLVSLQFTVNPDKLQVMCYPIDQANPKDFQSVSVQNMTFRLKDGEYLYQVIAEWTNSEKSSGKVHYAFQTSKPDLAIADIPNAEQKITAGTRVDTYLYADSALTKAALRIPQGAEVVLIETGSPNGSAKVVYDEYIGWIPSIHLELGTGSPVTSSQEDSTDAPKPESALSEAIASAVRQKYRSEKPDGLIHVESYLLLANETASATPLKGNTGHLDLWTVYLLVYHTKYSVSGEEPKEVAGELVPTAITFSVDETGAYSLKEYWTPRTGANYEKDVRDKFPGESADSAMNKEKYAEQLKQESRRRIPEYRNQ